MFRRAKKRILTEYPYDKLHEHLQQSVMRRWWTALWLAGWTLVGAIMAVLATWNPQEWTYILSGLIWGAIAGALFGLIMLLGYRVLVYGDEEQLFIIEGVAFLMRDQPSEAVLNTIDTRAEIGISGSQVRSLLPLFVLPLATPWLLPYLAEHTQFSTAVYSVIALSALLFVGFVLLRDLLRANVDAAIRHVVAEYRCTLVIPAPSKIEQAAAPVPSEQPQQLRQSAGVGGPSPSRRQQRRSASSLKGRRQ
jgi:hypothetical protein